MSVDPRFIIELKGKKFVLLAGLLDLAHQRGLASITTEVLTELCQPAEQFWVVRATGCFKDGEELRTWSAVGDASPASSQMRGAYLRHAETRSIARMLRFATNVGMTSAEEMGGPDEEQAAAVGSNGSARRAAVVPDQSAEPAPLSPGADIAAKHGPVCVVCEEPLKPSTYRAAMNHFGRGLCETHGRAERDRLRAEAETAAAS